MTFDSYYDPPEDEEPDPERYECDQPGCKGDGKYEYERRRVSPLYLVKTGIPNVCDEFLRQREEEGDAPITACGTCYHLKECH